MTNVSNTGTIGTLFIESKKGDAQSALDFLVSSGIAKPDAEDFSKIIASEKPESKNEPFGEKAKIWIANNLSKAIDGSCKAGISVATDVLKKAALQYYGYSDS